MYKFIKKAVLMAPPVKKQYDVLQALRKENGRLKTQNEALSEQLNGPRQLEISTIVSSNDRMLNNSNIDIYMRASHDAIKCIKDALSLRQMPRPSDGIKTILDLPCGHGRVLRSLKAYWPNAEITACDLDKGCVDFCVQTFGVNGVYSDVDVSKINITSKFDLIWCGSLISHTEAAFSKQIVDFFIDRLELNGVLVITNLGRFFKTIQESYQKLVSDELFDNILSSYDASGQGYVSLPWEPSDSGYGLALQKPSWTLSLVEGREDVTVLYFSERRWADNNQDVLALVKKPITTR